MPIKVQAAAALVKAQYCVEALHAKEEAAVVRMQDGAVLTLRLTACTTQNPPPASLVVWRHRSELTERRNSRELDAQALLATV